MKNRRITGILGAVLLAAAVTVTGIPAPVLAAGQTDSSQSQQEEADPDAENTSTSESVRGAGDGTTTADTAANTSKEVADDENTIHISSIDDLKKVAGKAHYDQWSVGKRIVLDADLDLTGQDIRIASFGGTFDGQDHTISGFTVTSQAACVGVFETIQSSGLVENLKVVGTLTPGGTQIMIGGIAGTNYGTIRNCSFNGIISANAQVGGIAGRNETSGIIESCTAGGNITGDSYTGGIAGYNAGTIRKCTGRMNVNITYSDTTVTMDQLSETLENILMSGRVNSTENVTARTDSGGIAGYSSGVIDTCTNDGTIGYEHVGYNVGGIAGRSSGYVQNCDNHGTIHGRKDVGGIVGQQQPYLALQFSQSTLDGLNSEIDALKDDADALVNQADSSVSSINSGISQIAGLAGSASNSMKTITDRAESDLNEAAQKLNSAGDTLTQALNDTSGVMGQVGTQVDQLLANATAFNDLLNQYLNSVELSDEDKAKIQSDYSAMTNGISSIQSAAKSLTDTLADQSLTAAQRAARALDAIRALRNAPQSALNAAKDLIQWLTDNQARIPQVDTLISQITELQNEIQSVIDALDPLASMADSIERALNQAGSGSSSGSAGSAVSDVISALRNLQDPFDGISTDLQQELNEILNYEQNGFTDEEKSRAQELLNSLISRHENVKSAISELNSLSDQLSGDVSNLPNNISGMQQKLTSVINGLADEANKASSLADILYQHINSIPNLEQSGLYAALQNIINTGSSADGIIAQAQDILGNIAGINLRANGISDEISQAGNALYGSLGSITSVMQSLSSSLSGTTSGMASSVRSMNDHLDKIADLLQEAYDTQTSGDNGSITDSSDSVDYSNITQGRTTACTNRGEVNADNNVGGVVGTVGVEYDLDPEQDIQQIGDSSLNFDFFARAVIDHCINYGEVISKNNYTGGIAARMELGYVDGGENYGRIKGGADYVGGISGYSVGTVRNSYAKCDISGSRYVGGIVGYGVKLANNASMISISSSEQYAGAIAGRVKDVNSDVTNNVFISNVLHGIDSVSYKGIAQGTTHKALMASGNVPANYSKIRILFEADDTIAYVLNIDYGGSVRADQIPAVPAKAGFVGKWSETVFENMTRDTVVTAVYTRELDAVSGGEKRDGGADIFLVEGSFTEGDSAGLVAQTPEGDETERWHVTIPDDGQSTHTCRYLPVDMSTEHTELYLIADNGTRTKLDTGTNGKYLTFTADGDAFTFSAVTAETDDRERLITIAVIAAAVLVLLLLIIRGNRRRRKAKKEQEEKQKAEEQKKKLEIEWEEKEKAERSAEEKEKAGKKKKASGEGRSSHKKKKQT